MPWESHTTNFEVLNRASMTSVKATIIHQRLHWLVHVYRMDPSRLLKKIFYGELTDRNSPRAAPKMWYKDKLKCTMKATNINLATREQTAKDRGEPRSEAQRTYANSSVLSPPYLVNIVCIASQAMRYSDTSGSWLWWEIQNTLYWIMFIPKSNENCYFYA